MLKKKGFLLILIFSSLISQVTEAKNIVTLANHEAPPYTSQNGGILTEIVVRAFEEEGYTVNVKTFPWKRGLKWAEKGVVDGLFGAWYRQEREKWFIYSQLFIENELVFLKRKGTDITFNGDYHSLKPYRIGYILGYADPPGFGDAKDALQVDLVPDNRVNLKKLAIGRLDLVMIDRFIARYIITHEMPEFRDAFEEIDYLLARDMNYVIFSKQAQNIQIKVEAFNHGIKSLMQKGVIQEIMKKHGF